MPPNATREARIIVFVFKALHCRQHTGIKKNKVSASGVTATLRRRCYNQAQIR